MEVNALTLIFVDKDKMYPLHVFLSIIMQKLVHSFLLFTVFVSKLVLYSFHSLMVWCLMIAVDSEIFSECFPQTRILDWE